MYGWWIKQTVTKQFVKVIDPDTLRISLVDNFDAATRFDSRPQALVALNSLGLFSPDAIYQVVEHTIPSPSREEMIAKVKAASHANEAERFKHRLAYGGPGQLNSGKVKAGFGQGPFGGKQSGAAPVVKPSAAVTPIPAPVPAVLPAIVGAAAPTVAPPALLFKAPPEAATK
jgi:hypothetical protein